MTLPSILAHVAKKGRASDYVTRIFEAAFGAVIREFRASSHITAPVMSRYPARMEKYNFIPNALPNNFLMVVNGRAFKRSDDFLFGRFNWAIQERSQTVQGLAKQAYTLRQRLNYGFRPLKDDQPGTFLYFAASMPNNEGCKILSTITTMAKVDMPYTGYTPAEYFPAVHLKNLFPELEAKGTGHFTTPWNAPVHLREYGAVIAKPESKMGLPIQQLTFAAEKHTFNPETTIWGSGLTPQNQSLLYAAQGAGFNGVFTGPRAFSYFPALPDPAKVSPLVFADLKAAQVRASFYLTPGERLFTQVMRDPHYLEEIGPYAQHVGGKPDMTTREGFNQVYAEMAQIASQNADSPAAWYPDANPMNGILCPTQVHTNLPYEEFLRRFAT